MATPTQPHVRHCVGGVGRGVQQLLGGLWRTTPGPEPYHIMSRPSTAESIFRSGVALRECMLAVRCRAGCVAAHSSTNPPCPSPPWPLAHLPSYLAPAVSLQSCHRPRPCRALWRLRIVVSVLGLSLSPFGTRHHVYSHLFAASFRLRYWYLLIPPRNIRLREREARLLVIRMRMCVWSVIRSGFGASVGATAQIERRCGPRAGELSATSPWRRARLPPSRSARRTRHFKQTPRTRCGNQRRTIPSKVLPWRNVRSVKDCSGHARFVVLDKGGAHLHERFSACVKTHLERPTEY